MSDTRVYLEEGPRWVFAAALDWPGWCRRGRGELDAIDTLTDYAERYAAVAGAGFSPGRIEVVGRLKGNSTTDFGAPDVIGPWDEELLTEAETSRMVDLLEESWRYFDATAAAAPAGLRKGPRGGGRDRDAVAQHVREAERHYTAKLGVRILPRTPWPEQRVMVADAIRFCAPSSPWPVRYAIRRYAWHVLDHAWEIEDKS